MMKQHKWKCIISSLLILLPIVAGLLLWDHLPEEMATHWGINGEVDDTGGKWFVSLLLPFILLALHWLCLFITFRDPKNKGQSNKALGLVFWIIPATSIFVNGMIYSIALNAGFDFYKLFPLFVGLLFVIIGNYMPKCKQNHTLGVKVKWTLDNEANWNATHRFAGMLWVIGGLCIMLCVFLPGILQMYGLFIVLIPMVLFPVFYSYGFYRGQLTSGTITKKKTVRTQKQKIGIAVAVVSVIIILGFCAILMFTGDISIHYGETDFTIEADYYNDLTVDYSVIDSVEYLEKFDHGVRSMGFASARLHLGRYENEEFNFTLYAYSSCDAAVLISVDDRLLVICGEDAAATQKIYNTLTEKVSSGS